MVCDKTLKKESSRLNTDRWLARSADGGCAISPSAPLANSNLSRRSVNAGVIRLLNAIKNYGFVPALYEISLGIQFESTSQRRLRNYKLAILLVPHST